jgi:CelD/BcsL family acetyltransferase involved in cellulose biosynthesis
VEVPLSVEAVADSGALPGLADEWDRLIDARHPGAVFRSAAWLVPWWRAFGADAELRVLAARRGGRLVGALPAYRARSPLGVTRLRLLGDGVVGSDYLGVVAAPADAATVHRAIAARLVDGEDDLELEGLAANDPLLDALEAARPGRLARVPLLPCPYLMMQSPFERWLAALPHGAGAQLRRRRRWLEKQPGFRLQVATAEDEVADALETLLALHDARWAGDGGSDGIPTAAVRAFHREVAPVLARRGEARLFVLHADGAPRAALYGFERGERFSFYQSGLDPAWRARSVGTVVLGAAIEDAFARGLREFDFLRGDESYKSTFASGRRELVRARMPLAPSARAARLLERANLHARSLAKRALPPDAVEWLRRARRRRSARS